LLRKLKEPELTERLDELFTQYGMGYLDPRCVQAAREIIVRLWREAMTEKKR